MATVIRSFTVPLSSVMSGADRARLNELRSFLQSQLDSYCSNKEFINYCLTISDELKGNFWAKAGAWLGKPYLQWPIGQNAKYFRVVIDIIRQTSASLKDRISVAEIAASFDYDISKMNDIRAACHEVGLYPFNAAIRSICRAKSVPSFPSYLQLKLDYGQGDKQIIHRDGLSYLIKVRDKWLPLTVVKPHYLRDGAYGFTNPTIEGDSVRIAYKVDVQPQKSNGVHLGVDLGKIKVFTGGVVTVQGEYGAELAPSKELESFHCKVDRLYRECKRIWLKQQKIASEVAQTGSLDLAFKWFDLDERRRSIRAKITRMKKNEARLVARDIVAHALTEGASTVKMEDLGFANDVSGHWNYGEIYGFLQEACDLAGIDLVKVDARNSSKTNPFTDEYSDRYRGRNICFSTEEMDRDRAAALELARRPAKKRRARKVRTQVPKIKVNRLSKRDRNMATPKRPKLTRRTTEHKVLKKKTGQYPIVAVSAELGQHMSCSGRLNTDSQILKPNIDNSVLLF